MSSPMLFPLSRTAIRRLANEISKFMVGPIDPGVFLEEFLPGANKSDTGSFDTFQNRMREIFVPALKTNDEHNDYMSFLSFDLTCIAHPVL
jgi:hypothetical protein